jgi:hypothetical protein
MFRRGQYLKHPSCIEDKSKVFTENDATLSVYEDINVVRI